MSESLLIQALQHQPLSRPPVWLMRQAGRYLPEYRALRAHFPDFIAFCLASDAATEATLQPMLRFGLDAAIIFADILTIPHALGHKVTFTEGHGPAVEPFTHPDQLANLRVRLPDIMATLHPVPQTVKQTRAALPAHRAVIGFCGGPFTLACYMLDTKPSLGIPNTLHLLAEDPATFHALLNVLTEACATYLSAQIEAGANAVQVFESWALAAPAKTWETAINQPLLAICKAVKQQHPDTPILLFPRGATEAQLQTLVQQNKSAFQGLSLSTEHNLPWAVKNLQPHVTIQGNLDPLLTTGEPAPLLTALTTMLDTAAIHPGYIVNLGHGLTPQTKPDNIQKLVDVVKAWQPPTT